MRTLRQVPSLTVLALLAVAGCAGDPWNACTMVAARQGIGMQVPAGLATESSSVRLFVCQDGDCRRISFQLRPSPAMVDKGCNTDGVCTARASPTGRRHGFGTLPELTTSRARIQLALRAPSGKAVLERRVSAKPEMVYPNGRSCSGQAPQLQLQITGDGGIRVG